MGMVVRSLLALSLGLLLAQAAMAGNLGYQGNPDQAPDPSPDGGSLNLPACLDNQGHPLSVNNEQVLRWKSSTPNQFRDRAFIRGTLVKVFVVNNTHLHLEVYLGDSGGTPSRENDVEVIYNQDFGQAPQYPQLGATVSACGDYITSTEQSGPYPASPDGAILHWVHKAMNDRHPNGFFAIDEHLYGQMDAPPRQSRYHGN